ncbi:hypothetical protein ACUN8C_11365 [Kushneria sp. Sum13]|uniref:hypothetical protein n=1 Tax=Kushneria sp. Sum13 TaxID=3459196 RepID=UPI004045DFC8
MMLTDKCLAMACAAFLIYGMIFAGGHSSSSAAEGHYAPMHRQAQGDISLQGHVASQAP